MRGIVVKPKHCCNYTGSLGRVLTLSDEQPKNPVVCSDCGTFKKTKEGCYKIVGEVNSFIEKDRVKILPDDLEGKTDEISKIKENESVN